MSQKVEWNPKWLMETLNQFYARVLGMSNLLSVSHLAHVMLMFIKYDI